jgi:hypothetical protein
MRFGAREPPSFETEPQCVRNTIIFVIIFAPKKCLFFDRADSAAHKNRVHPVYKDVAPKGL